MKIANICWLWQPRVCRIYKHSWVYSKENVSPYGAQGHSQVGLCTYLLTATLQARCRYNQLPTCSVTNDMVLYKHLYCSISLSWTTGQLKNAATLSPGLHLEGRHNVLTCNHMREPITGKGQQNQPARSLSTTRIWPVKQELAAMCMNHMQCYPVHADHAIYGIAKSVDREEEYTLSGSRNRSLPS